MSKKPRTRKKKTQIKDKQHTPRNLAKLSTREPGEGGEGGIQGTKKTITYCEWVVDIRINKLSKGQFLLFLKSGHVRAGDGCWRWWDWRWNTRADRILSTQAEAMEESEAK